MSETRQKFAFVIYVYDEDDDINNVWIDSIWTNESEAIQRLKILEESDNAILDTLEEKYPYRYKLLGYSKKFPWADGCTIRRENPDGTIHDYKYGIFCKRVFFNDKELLKPFNIVEYKKLVKEVEGKQNDV